MQLLFRPQTISSINDFTAGLSAFNEFGSATAMEHRQIAGAQVPVFRNEYWTSKQRDGQSIQEISYRACYKPQLPRFFVERFCKPDDVVYDPFMGRGTALIEAQMHGCRAFGNDVNPLASLLVGPRLCPPTLAAIQARLQEITLPAAAIDDEDLLVFFAPRTLQEIYGWRAYFRSRTAEHQLDHVDEWIRMVACNRLTGHSNGFFSVYTLPPNLAASVVSQRKINEKSGQTPVYRDTKALIYKKSRQLLRDSVPPAYPRQDFILSTSSAEHTPRIPANSVRLIVTSPPFVDTVDYIGDNWLRMWFTEVQLNKKDLWQLRKLAQWTERMTATLVELERVLQPDGVIAFEVGEVKKGTIHLENIVAEAAATTGLAPECIMINAQDFTKTANCWGVDNNEKGTNTNRIVILRKR